MSLSGQLPRASTAEYALSPHATDVGSACWSKPPTMGYTAVFLPHIHTVDLRNKAKPHPRTSKVHQLWMSPLSRVSGTIVTVAQHLWNFDSEQSFNAQKLFNLNAEDHTVINIDLSWGTNKFIKKWKWTTNRQLLILRLPTEIKNGKMKGKFGVKSCSFT